MRCNPIVSTSLLLTYYSFDLGNSPTDQVVQNWLCSYPAKWVLAAIVEALYQGRYKAASVERILKLWKLRGKLTRHFDDEFADLVCRILLKRSKHRLRRSRQRSLLLPSVTSA